MITYAERACFGAQHLQLLARVQTYVQHVSSTWGNELRCHELVRAVHTVLAEDKLVVMDGKCGPIEHSWLRCNDGVILDPYVPGRLPSVQLVDPIVGTAYRSGMVRGDIKQPIIDRLVAEMRAADTTRARARPAHR